MTFVTQFLAGAALAATVSYVFQSQIQSGSAQLQSDLKAVTDHLNSLVPASDHFVPGEIPRRIPFSEALKSRWNESVFETARTMHETDWSEAAVKAFRETVHGVHVVKEMLTGSSTVEGEEKP